MIQHKKLLVILLVISVSFNVFFILGYAHTRNVIKTLKTPEGRAEFVSKKLKLNQEQKAALFQLGEKIGMEKLKMKKQYSKEVEIFWQELLKTNPDPNKISAGLELRSALDMRLLPLQQDFLIKFLTILNPEQKKLFVNLLSKNKQQNYK